ncbi:hypothetical protein ACLB1E_00100 [Escherichia coli]
MVCNWQPASVWPETLRQVTQHAEHVVNALNTEKRNCPANWALKPLGTTPDEITAICRDANYDDRCAGLVVWLHTFSPAKAALHQWLTTLNKPLLQLHILSSNARRCRGTVSIWNFTAT